MDKRNIYGNNEKIVICDHPLVKHKITKLRNKETKTTEFRALVEEISILIGYEALRGLKLEEIEIETPIKKTKGQVVAGKKLALIPILRAGLGMVDGFLKLVPTAKLGHIGMCRDEETHKPESYYFKLPQDIEKRDIFIVDPMLATGGSAAAAIDFIKQNGGKNINFVCIIAAPEGLNKLSREHPDINIFVGQLDEELNEDAYIVPGLGDAGDRIFGTKY